MYIFHRTSEEKLHFKAPLLVESWNFISTLKSRINKKKKEKEKYPNTRGNRETLFSSECLWNLCTSGHCVNQEGQHHQLVASWAATLPTSVQSGTAKLPPRPYGAARHIHASVCCKIERRNVSRLSGLQVQNRSTLVDHFIDCGLLVTRASHDVFVVRRDVAAKDRRGFFGLRKRKRRLGSFEVNWVS